MLCKMPHRSAEWFYMVLYVFTYPYTIQLIRLHLPKLDTAL